MSAKSNLNVELNVRHLYGPFLIWFCYHSDMDTNNNFYI